MKNFRVLFAASIVVTLFLSLWVFLNVIFPHKIISRVTPADFNVKFEKVTFTSSDQLTLHGWFIPSKTPTKKTIIVLHGYPFDKGNVLPANLFLYKKYNLLFFDFRSLGESEGSFTTIGKNEILDLLAAINFLKARGIHEIGIIGFSMGGAVAIMTAPNVPEIKAMVIFESFAHLDWLARDYFVVPVWREILTEIIRLWTYLFLRFDLMTISPAQAAAQLHIPILLIHSKEDHLIPFKHFEAMQKALQNNPYVESIVMEKGLHGQLPVTYQEVVGNFFRQHLSSP